MTEINRTNEKRIIPHNGLQKKDYPTFIDPYSPPSPHTLIR